MAAAYGPWSRRSSRIHSLQLTMHRSASIFASCNGLPVRAPPRLRLDFAFRSRSESFRQLGQQLHLHVVARATSDQAHQSMAMAEESQANMTLDSLLARAVPSPRYIKCGGAAAVVALAAHSEPQSDLGTCRCVLLLALTMNSMRIGSNTCCG